MITIIRQLSIVAILTCFATGLLGQYSGSLHTSSTFNSRSINTSLPVGTLEGSPGVSEGSSNYTIPIQVAPGTNGMTPDIKISYSSTNGGGVLGRGWAISGLSSISRVNRSIYFDDEADPIEINNNDRFELDGQRLILKSGTYGAHNATYGLEREDWATVYSYDNSGYGPLKFKVIRKDGVEIEYGYTWNEKLLAGSGSKILRWYMNKITYKDGNYITFHYADVNNERVVTHVKYTGNIYTGQGTFNEITFHYNGNRIDKNKMYVTGNGYETKNLLTSINVNAEGQLSSKYVFKYAHNNVNSFLKEIERYGSDGTTKFNSTILKYGAQPTHYQVGSSNIIQGQSVDLFSGDFDGDGYSDFLGATYAYSNGKKYHTGLKAYKRTSTSSNYTNYYNKSFSGLFQVVNDVNNPKYHTFFTTDYSGDGRDDIMIHKLGYTSTGGLKVDNIYQYNSTGSNFSISSKPLPTISSSTYNRFASHLGDGQYYFPGDYDADGATDYLMILSNGTGFKAFISFPSKSIYNQLVSVPGYSNYLGGIWVHSDAHNVIEFDGDGKNDIMITKGSESKIFNFSKVGNTWTAKQIHAAGFPTKWHKMLFADFNGDGKTDMLTRGSQTNNYTPWYKAISTGTSWLESSFSFNHTPKLTGSYSDDKVVLADFNGDGRTDIFHSYPDFVGWTAVDSDTDVYYSRGNDFYRRFEDHTPLDGFTKSPVFDLNGDGRVEVINRTSYTSPFSIFYLNKEGKELLLEGVKNGLNYESLWSYKRMTQTSGFYTKGSSISGSVNNVQLPINLVYESKNQNGLGGHFTTRYSYKEAKIHKEGKGFLGIKEITTSDISTGFKSVNTKSHYGNYHVMLPYIDKVYKTSNNVLLSQTIYNKSLIDQGNKRFWLRPNFKETNKYLEDQYFKSTFTHDSYGNVTKTVENRDYIETHTTDITYGTYGTPIPAKPLTITKTTARSGQNSYQSKVRNYWNSKGQLYRRDDFDGKSKEVRNYFYFNTNGTTKETRNYSNGISYRKHRYYYDSKGRYVTSSYNPLNQVSTTAYDKRWGVPTSTVSINSMNRSYLYDVFGRLKTSNFNNEQYSVHNTYHWNITSGGFVYYRKVAHSGAPDKKTWYDAVGRERQSQTEGFQNLWITSKKEYDTKGNIYKIHAPYKSGEWPLVTTHQYDSYNRLYSKSNSLGTTSISYSYNNGKVKTTTTNPAGHVSSKTVDGTGKIVESSDNGGTLTFEYWSNGLRSKVKKGSQVLVSNEYDDYARQTKLVDINSGTITYEYDAFAQLKKEINANNEQTLMYYDQLGRMTSKYLPEGTTSITYYPTGSGAATNQVKKITGFNGNTEEYTYNSNGFETSKKEKVDGVYYNTYFTVDKYGKTTAINYPSGYGIKYNYDSNGYLLDIKNSSQSHTLFINQGMNGFNKYKKYKLGNNKTTHQYFTYGIPNRTYTTGVQNLYTFWNYNKGTVTQRYDAVKNKREYFQYDNLNRLTKSYGTGLQTIDVSYQSNGNISYKTDVGSYSYHYNKINAVTNVSNSSFTIPSITQDITYSSFHQPELLTEGINELTYTYGPDEKRVKSVLKENGVTKNTRYYFDGFEKNVNKGGTEWLHYISAGENIIAIVKRVGFSDTYYYTYTDHLGSIVTVTDVAGTSVADQNFDAWGRRRNPTTWTYTSIPTPPSFLYRGFTLHEDVPKFNLINMNGRMYDPIIARMLSVDNYVQDPFSTQSQNRFSYVMNNPFSYTDPDGEVAWFVPVIIGAAIGGTTGGIIAHSNGQAWWKGAIVGAFVGAGVGAFAAPAIGATGITTTAGTATQAWGLTTAAIQGANVSMGITVVTGVFGDGFDLDNLYKSGLVGAASGLFTASGGFGLLREGAKNGIVNRYAYQAIGTAGRSIGNNWANGQPLFSKVTVGVGPVNLTFGKDQKLLQWQNNIGNIVANTLGIANLATGGKARFDFENMTPVYRGGLLGKIYANNYTDATGAHAVLGIDKMSNKIYQHELHHIWQSRAMGDAFLLNYFMQGGQAAFLPGGFFGSGNFFEGQAYGHDWFK